MDATMRATLAAAALAILGGCGWPEAIEARLAPEPVRVATIPVEKLTAFLGAVAGRPMKFGSTTLLIAEDGRLAGAGPDGPVDGAWRWSEGFFCRIDGAGGGSLPVGCYAVEVDADEATFTGFDGARSGPWRVG